MSRADLGQIIESERLNAALAWVLVVFVVVGALASLFRGDLLWTGFAASVAVLALLPPVSFRTPLAMLPWEVLALAAFPMIGRAFAPALVGDLATYLSVAALALIIAVELHLFTPVEMSYRFAVAFVVVTTMATAGVWAVVRWVADIYLGTGFIASENALMWEFVASTVAGVGAGIVFEGYVRRRVHPERLPEAIR